MGPVTQEDPIGIAGGLNLYGYANGDPINYSDPFGLCTDPSDPLCQWFEASFSMLGAIAGFAAGGGPGAWATVASGGAAAPAAVATTAATTTAGAAAGLALGQLLSPYLFSGESSATASGRQAHADYSETMSAQGYVTNKQSIPGTRLRPDAIDVDRGIIRELKPNNARAIQRGLQQLQRYLDAAEQAFGRRFRGILDTYGPGR